jgi:hypothetical protein
MLPFHFVQGRLYEHKGDIGDEGVAQIEDGHARWNGAEEN